MTTEPFCQRCMTNHEPDSCPAMPDAIDNSDEAVESRRTTLDPSDVIWHALTPAAKASWVAAMQPQPEPEPYKMAPATLSAIVDAYVAQVRANTVPAYDATTAVLDAIRLDGHENSGSRWDIVMEMSDIAGQIGITGPDYDADPDGTDAFNNALHDALPAVAQRLQAVTLDPDYLQGTAQ